MQLDGHGYGAVSTALVETGALETGALETGAVVCVSHRYCDVTICKRHILITIKVSASKVGVGNS